MLDFEQNYFRKKNVYENYFEEKLFRIKISNFSHSNFIKFYIKINHKINNKLFVLQNEFPKKNLDCEQNCWNEILLMSAYTSLACGL